MAKVRLSTPYPPQSAEGEKEMHYGVFFAVVDSGRRDNKDRPIMVLETELADEEALVMEEAGRVSILSLDSDEEEKAAEREKQLADEKAADEKAAAERKAADEKAAADIAAKEKLAATGKDPAAK